MTARWALTGGAGMVLFPVVLVSAVLSMLTGVGAIPGAATSGLAGTPSTQALADIPADYLAWYRHWAGECPGLGWSVVGAIGKVESNHGRSRLPGVHAGANWAGAAGPMQFGIGGKAGDTWASYGRDGDGDGAADVYSPADAIRAAVGYLCDHGAAAPGGLRDAVFAYNHSTAYVDQVLALAARYADSVVTSEPAALLANQRVRLTSHARADLEAGVVDPRVITILTTVAQRYPIAVSVLKTGHSPFVAGTRTYSHHYFGRAVDIHRLNGQPVSANNPAAREVTAWLASLTGPLRPDEVGSPFPEFEPVPGHFHDSGHRGHIHVGYRAAP